MSEQAKYMEYAMKNIFGALFLLFIVAASAPALTEEQLLGDPGFEESTPNGTFPNAICPPAFPEDPDARCWHACTSGSDAGAVCTSTAAHSGNNGLWEYTGSSTGGWWSGPYQEREASVSELYRAACWIRSDTDAGGEEEWVAGSKALVRVCYKSDYSGTGMCVDNRIKCYDSPALTTGDTLWREYGFTTPPAPQGTNYVQMQLYVEKPGVGGQSIVNVDDCVLEKVVWGAAYSLLFDDESDLEVLRQYRDTILAREPKGALYMGMLDKTSGESLKVLVDNPELIMEAKDIIDTNMEAVSDVLNGKEGTIHSADEIIAFLEAFAEKSPPVLRILVTRMKRNLVERRESSDPYLGFKLNP
jgi:hypothetical protein